jgi:hypothetical protein
MRRRRVEAPGSTIGLRDVVVKVGDAVVAGERAPDEVDGLLVTAGLKRQHAEQIERVEMIGVPRQNLPVQTLGFVEPTALVQRQRLRKSLFRVARHMANPYSTAQVEWLSA